MTGSSNEDQSNQTELSGDMSHTTLDPREEQPVEHRTELRSNIVSARGTSDGLVLRVDGRVERTDLIHAVRGFLDSRRSFLSGNDVAFEWIGSKPEDSVTSELVAVLADEFSVSVRPSKQKNPPPTKPVEHATEADQCGGAFSVFGGGKTTPFRKPSSERSVSLFDGIDTMENRQGFTNANSWDDPDTRIMYGTLRSGQKVETEHSVVIFGDVNSGAEVIAGGDIVILGTLRGIAHAGAYDESGGGRVIFSLNLRPTQLRIGLIISRGSGSDEAESTPKGGLPEVARVDGNMIIVEPYQSRTVWVRRRE
jgi:septum site-determining protein MinC